MTELISSHSNPIVKQIRLLHQRKTRRQSGLFLVEGIHHVGEAVAAGWPIETLVYAPETLTSEFANTLVERQQQVGTHCIAINSQLFSSIAEKDNPQGLLAILRQKQHSLKDLQKKHFQFGVGLVSPQDPGNVGTILRTLDATGTDGLFLLDGGVDVYHPSLVRASMGTLFWKSIAQASFDEFDQWRRQLGYRLLGSSAHADQDYRTYEPDERPAILMLGNEQKGLSAEQLAACDLTISLPMLGRVSSLNLSVAAGVLLYSMVVAKN